MNKLYVLGFSFLLYSILCAASSDENIKPMVPLIEKHDDGIELSNLTGPGLGLSEQTSQDKKEVMSRLIELNKFEGGLSDQGFKARVQMRKKLANQLFAKKDDEHFACHEKLVRHCLRSDYNCKHIGYCCCGTFVVANVLACPMAFTACLKYTSLSNLPNILYAIMGDAALGWLSFMGADNDCIKCNTCLFEYASENAQHENEFQSLTMDE